MEIEVRLRARLRIVDRVDDPPERGCHLLEIGSRTPLAGQADRLPLDRNARFQHEGDFLVVDTCSTHTPAVGSMDSMIWAAKGFKGCLTNGGTCDTDEVLTQKALPVWSRWIVQPMYQARVEWSGDGMPVEIGGMLVKSGDLVVADGDGAIVVPVDVVDDVPKYAIQESENDKIARAMLFDHLGIKHDDSVKSHFKVPSHPYAMTREKLAKRLPGKRRK